jgi:hypothetical protein
MEDEHNAKSVVASSVRKPSKPAQVVMDLTSVREVLGSKFVRSPTIKFQVLSIFLRLSRRVPG